MFVVMEVRGGGGFGGGTVCISMPYVLSIFIWEAWLLMKDRWQMFLFLCKINNRVC